MYRLSGENRELYEKVVGKLKKLVAETMNDLKPKLVILYGSIVRGDWHTGSDLDLLVVSDSVSSNFKDRGDRLFGVVQGFPVEPHVYTTQEFGEMLAHGRMTVLDALTEGTILYAQKNYLKEIKQKLEQTMQNLKPEKISIGWKLKRG